MTPSTSSSSINPAIQRMREAEQALFQSFGIRDVMVEQFLPLRTNPALLGVRTARVFALTQPPQQPQDATNQEIPILLVHGGGGTAGDWANLLPHLAKPRRTLYVVERPGNGLSEPMDYTNCDLAEFSEAFLDEVIAALKLTKVHLVGNSLGGGTVLWYSFAQARKGTSSSSRSSSLVVSVSGLGVPAGFQGMVCFPKFICWLANSWIVQQLATVFPPYFPFIPVMVLVLVLGIPYRSLTPEYNQYAWRSHCIHHNVISFLSILYPLWEASCNGKGWKLTELNALSQTIPVLITEGKGEILLTRSHRAEFVRQLGHSRYIRDLGVGHAPWVSDPIGYARVLEQFWQESEEATDENSTINIREPIKATPASSPKSILQVLDAEKLGNFAPPKVD